MPDRVPLYFEQRLGGLFPVNAAAQAAMRDTQGRVRVEIKRTRGNVRRNNLYWAALSVAVPMLEDRLEGAQLTVDMMHRILKRKHGLARPVVNKQTGEIIDYDYDSVRFASMPENDRSEYITAALGTLSKMLGVEVRELMKEAENGAA